MDINSISGGFPAFGEPQRETKLSRLESVQMKNSLMMNNRIGYLAGLPRGDYFSKDMESLLTSVYKNKGMNSYLLSKLHDKMALMRNEIDQLA